MTLVPYEWKSVITLGGGFVTGLNYSTVEKDLLYARTDIGGAYRFDVARSTWIPITDHLGPDESNFLGIESLVPDPQEANRVYMAVGTYTQSWGTNGAILRSNDRGDTWEVTQMPIKMGGNEYGRSMGERLAVDPNDTNVLFFGSRRNGLWKSTDRGVSWSEVKSFPVNDEANGIGITFISFDGKSSVKGKPTPLLYLGFASLDGPSLYRSRDYGKTFEPVPGQPKGVMPSHGDLDKDGVLYLSYANGPGPGELTTGSVWKYVAKGDQWTNITPLQPNENDKFGYGGLSASATKSGVVMVTTLDRWTHGDEILRTEDGGKTWKALGAKAVRDDAGAKYLYWGRDKPSASGWMGEIAINPFNDAEAMYVTGQGNWSTRDANKAMQDQPTHWKFENLGLEECAVSDLASPPTGVPLLSTVFDLGGFRHDSLDTPPSGGLFLNPIFGSGSSIDFAEQAPDIVVRVGSNDKQENGALSTDQGKTWKPFPAKIVGFGGQIAIGADGKNLVWSPKKGPVVYSEDLGQHWKPSQGTPEVTDSPDWAAVGFKVVADRVNPRRFYAYSTKDGQALSSDDAGKTFRVVFDTLPTLADYEAHRANIQTPFGLEGNVWFVTGKELYRTKDGGAHIDTVDGVENCTAVGFGKPKEKGGHPAVYLAGVIEEKYGFYRSDDEGRSWARINDDRHQFGGTNLMIGDPKIYGRVYVGTHGRGIFYADPR
jgi:photosystem II stability/assembly factor-like uncharacterized protein